MSTIVLQSMLGISKIMTLIPMGLYSTGYSDGYYHNYGYGYGYGYLSYLVFMLPALLLGLWAQASVKGTFNKYSKIANSRRMTGAQAARMILDQNRLTYVRIEQVSGKLTDHFDPRDNVIRLSSEVCNSSSIGAIGVACHEAGHAVQHAEDYGPIKLRNAIIPVCNFGSSVGPMMIFIGCLFGGAGLGRGLIFWGIVLFSMVALFQLVTLPVEFDASNRALAVIRDSGQFSDADYKGAKKVLRAAAMTYVAALVTTIMQILYYVSRFLLGGRRRN